MARKFCAICEVEPVDHGFKHGRNAYSYHRCRCEICLEDRRSQQRSENLKYGRKCKRCSASQPCDFTHGTRTGYDRHECRCDECRAANNNRGETALAYRRAYFAEYAKTPAGNAARSRKRERKAHKFGTRRGPYTVQEDAVVQRVDMSPLEKAAALGRSIASVLDRSRRLDGYRPPPLSYKKCVRCRDGVAHTFKHGASSYFYHDCRCTVCVRGASGDRNSSRNRNNLKEYDQ